MGEIRMAIEANDSARILCKDDQEGLKDLEQQHQKFITEKPEPKGIFTLLMWCSLQHLESYLPFFLDKYFWYIKKRLEVQIFFIEKLCKNA